jgi:hypothetical protein
VSEKPGVASVPPPLAAMPTIMAQIDRVVATLPPNKRLGATLNVDDDEGINVALVTKLTPSGSVAGVAWFGKKWGEPKLDYGISVRVLLGEDD